MLPVMFKNSWFPTVFDDFFNTDITTQHTAPAVNVKVDVNAYTMDVMTCYPVASLSEEQLLHLADFYISLCF